VFLQHVDFWIFSQLPTKFQPAWILSAMCMGVIVLVCLGVAAQGRRTQGIAHRERPRSNAETELLWHLLSSFNLAASGWKDFRSCNDEIPELGIDRHGATPSMQMPPPAPPGGSRTPLQSDRKTAEMYKVTREIVQARRAGHRVRNWYEDVYSKGLSKEGLGTPMNSDWFQTEAQRARKRPKPTLERLQGPRLRAQEALMQGLRTADAETLKSLIQASKDIGWTEERDPNLKWAQEKLDTLEGRALDEVQDVGRRVRKKSSAEVLQSQSFLAEFKAMAAEKLEEETEDLTVASGGKADEQS